MTTNTPMTNRITTTLATIARPFINAGRLLILTTLLLLTSIIIYIIVIEVTQAYFGEVGGGLLIPWALTTVIIFRICYHNVF